jgi:hypothetical protein
MKIHGMRWTMGNGQFIQREKIFLTSHRGDTSGYTGPGSVEIGTLQATPGQAQLKSGKNKLEFTIDIVVQNEFIL